MCPLKPLIGFKLVAPGLIDAKSEADFLRLYFEFGTEQGETAKELAKRAGYSSAGPISECLNGKREMSAKFVEQIAGELRTPALFKKLFVALAKKNRPDAFRVTSLEEAQKSYLNLRSRVREDFGQKLDRDISELDQAELIGSLELFMVYSSLEPNRGVTRSEIASRSTLPEDEVKGLLTTLTRHKLVYEVDGLYFSNRERVDMLSQAHSLSFQACFLKALELLNRQAQRMPERESDLFFHSTVLVDESTLRRVQDVIQAKVLETLDSETKDSGDRIAHVLVSVFTRSDPKSTKSD